MAVTTTPLGFKKPDGRELVRNIDNVIRDNADVAEREIQQVKKDLATAAPSIFFDGGGPGETYTEDQLIDGGVV